MPETIADDFNQPPVLTEDEVAAITAARDAIAAEAKQLVGTGQDMAIPLSAVTADGTFVSVMENRTRYNDEGWMTVRTGQLAEMVHGAPLAAEVVGGSDGAEPGATRWRGDQGTNITLGTGSHIHWWGSGKKEPPTLDGRPLFRLGDDDRPIPIA